MVKKTKKRNEKIDFEKESRKDKNTIIAVVMIAIAVTSIAVISYVLTQASNSGQAAIIDGIQCDNTQHDNFHTNAHLDIFINDQPYTVPGKIGIVNNTCLYWIHTNDTTGIIRIEAPNDEQFTLKQLFDIWKATSSNFPPNDTTTVYINGQQSTLNLNDTVIKSHDEITVVYGVRPSIIPTSYQFPVGL